MNLTLITFVSPTPVTQRVPYAAIHFGDAATIWAPTYLKARMSAKPAKPPARSIACWMTAEEHARRRRGREMCKAWRAARNSASTCHHLHADQHAAELCRSDTRLRPDACA